MERHGVSVLLPMHDEAENVRPVLESVFAALEASGLDHEVIAVDDGSGDGTFAELKKVAHPRLRVVRLRRRFGQTAALSAGFDHASGDVIVTMDADGQNDPRDIPRLLERIEAGADIVSGWRRRRHDRFWSRRLPSLLANRLISRVTGVRLHDYGCSLKAYRAHVLRETRLYGELHRFVPALASWGGARIEEIEVLHHARERGRSKYGIDRTLRVLLDLLTVKFLVSFGSRPIHVFGTLGLVNLLVGSAITLWLGFVRLVLREPIANRPLLLLGVLLVLVGLQFVSLGLLGEFLVRIYHESSGKKTYAVAEVLDLRDADPRDATAPGAAGQVAAPQRGARSPR